MAASTLSMWRRSDSLSVIAVTRPHASSPVGWWTSTVTGHHLLQRLQQAQMLFSGTDRDPDPAGRRALAEVADQDPPPAQLIDQPGRIPVLRRSGEDEIGRRGAHPEADLGQTVAEPGPLLDHVGHQPVVVVAILDCGHGRRDRR